MTFDASLLAEIRDRFHHVAVCPFQGPRVYFENAGGSLTLKAAVARTAELMTIPDNQGRANVASIELMKIIAQGRQDMKTMFGTSSGEVFIGETGTELLGRLIRNALFATAGTNAVGSHLEHPATYSAASRWAPIAGLDYEQVPFDPSTSVVSVEQYATAVNEGTGVATIIHASPVTGMHVDVATIAKRIRQVAPECFIIVDGIQHAAHGRIDVDDYGVDGYVVSGYKLFSRHNFGVAWVSDRLATIPHDQLVGAPAEVWEVGTRDTSAYAAFSEVVRYLEWVGSQVTEGETGEGSGGLSGRELIEAASVAIRGHEHGLVNAMLWGIAGLPGLAQLDNVHVVGPDTSEHRSGMVSFTVDGMDGPQVVAELDTDGVRTHARKADYYSAGVLGPLGLETCTRVSASHYNTLEEVEQFLASVNRIAGT
ncbi:MAG: aminotransferase class V-fold PLP-dependent enzyme [Actinomycetia bacterium]|nr:aminotransferase class V-fold PLP-dependent enzyme [Actinomycetes bacterium]MCP4224945.1 aminotransferase class V-fold PLP-dependent enzyme [Actinomycetes bacterium]MCP5031636.1 aminotransferase class V-fold PLP-dependent enzyme [Actinomycetes bacterium]